MHSGRRESRFGCCGGAHQGFAANIGLRSRALARRNPEGYLRMAGVDMQIPCLLFGTSARSSRSARNSRLILGLDTMLYKPSCKQEQKQEHQKET